MWYEKLWNDDSPIRNRFEGVKVPEWIEDTISPYDIAAIYQGGCDSGAYMPAVTYHVAMKIMGEHGDDVLDYLEEAGLNLAEILAAHSEALSWHGMASLFLTCAVETWAVSVIEQIDDQMGGD